jgi:hypothetical protein
VATGQAGKTLCSDTNWLRVRKVVERKGISRSSRLQARIRSQACRMRHEFPAHPASRRFDYHGLRSKLKKPLKVALRRGNLPVFALASANPLRQRRAYSTKPCLRPAWTRNDSSANHQIKNHRKGGILFGGGGGNRTRVQRSSTDSSTYLVLSFNLIHLPRTHTLQVNESPFI